MLQEKNWIPAQQTIVSTQIQTSSDFEPIYANTKLLINYFKKCKSFLKSRKKVLIKTFKIHHKYV